MKILDLPRVRAELDFGVADVRRLQEWLWFAGHRVDLDGRFGPATRDALAAFRIAAGVPSDLPAPGLIPFLTKPLRRALRPDAASPRETLREVAVRIARLHLDAGAREVPGGNRGPWIRIYGCEGEPWCAAFVTFVLRHAAELTGQPLSIPGSTSCDELADQARALGRLIEDPRPADVAPGDLLLLWEPKDGRRDFRHVGLVEATSSGSVQSIEGNTNPAGGREGFEVERRRRSLHQKSAIRLR